MMGGILPLLSYKTVSAQLDIKDIAENIPGFMTVHESDSGTYQYVNNRSQEILGYPSEVFLNEGITFIESLVHPDDLALFQLQKTGQGWENENECHLEYRVKNYNGDWQWVAVKCTQLKNDDDEDGKRILSFTVDISKRKSLEAEQIKLREDLAQLNVNDQRFRSFIEAVKDYAIFQLDPEGYVMSWNVGIQLILGYSEDEIINKHIEIVFPPNEQAQQIWKLELEQARSQGATVQEGIRVKKDGTTFYALSTVTAIWDPNGNLLGYSKIIRDVTEIKEAEETIRYHALHDTLTGLANRKALDDHFSLAQSLAIRHNYKLGLMFLDLDRFKIINDTLGHGIGDMILREVAQRLLQSVRKVDTVARLGGDEFIILLNEVSTAQDVVSVAEKILQAFVPVMRVQDQSLHVSTSIGIAMYPTDGQDIYTLLKNADTALYRAKDAGRNRFQFYNYSMNLQSVTRLSLEQDLRTAVEKGQMYIAYQPFIDVKTKKVLGVEALVRWNHPKLGLLFPYDFIPLAEETGMIVPIGKWILEQVCQQGKLLQDQGMYLQMTINLSARQFTEVELVDTITETLTRCEFDANCLELEITESVAMENITRTSSKLNDLKKLGITIAIDDFGTGYSSLSYLKRFPVQKLKIDKSFIKHAITDAQDSTIIRAIISMGHNLGLKVCAEGIEDDQQMALLASMGCDIAQGYFISKPLTAKDLVTWLEKQGHKK